MLKLFLCLFVVYLNTDNAKAGGSIYGSYGNGRLTGGVKYTKGGWSVYGSGYTDLRGNYGGEIGASYSWGKRRAAKLDGEKFVLLIQLDKCDFTVYDENDDNVITPEEMRKLFFPDMGLANRLFKAFDSNTGDRKITKEEFDKTAPEVIEGCEKNPKRDI